MIRVENLSKRFGDIHAVKGVSFEVAKGEIYGLLGPNGAGKTTTLSMITGLLEADDGRVTFDGTDLASRPREFRRRLGVVPQEIALYEDLSARENLRFWGGLYGLSGKELKEAADRVLDQVGLAGRADEPVKQFSGGMKRRLNLALGLVHSPDAVLLDEPTVGIDPQARLNILEVVEKLAAGGTAVLYTTHYLEEAERLCHRIGILDHGEILAEGTLAELTSRLGESETVTLTGRLGGKDGSDAEDLRRRLDRLEGVRVLSSEDDRLVLASAGGRTTLSLLEAVADLDSESISIEPPSLNALFLDLTGRELRD